MSKIMELAEYYATLREDGVRRELEDEARAALQAEVEKIELLATATHIVMAERDALREKLAIAKTANNLFDKALLAAHPQGAEGVVYEYWNEARKFMEATK